VVSFYADRIVGAGFAPTLAEGGDRW